MSGKTNYRGWNEVHRMFRHIHCRNGLMAADGNYMYTHGRELLSMGQDF